MAMIRSLRGLMMKLKSTTKSLRKQKKQFEVVSGLGNATTFFQSCQYILYAANLQSKVVWDTEVVLEVIERRRIYMNSNIMIIACVTLFITQILRISTFKKVMSYGGLQEGRDEVIFILSLTMYIEIPLGVMYIVLSVTMANHKAREVLST